MVLGLVPAAINHFCGTGKSNRRKTTIDMLPDDLLLEIFYFCRIHPSFKFFFHGACQWKWHLLAHVCQRWRQIIFESPQRLDIKILCTHETPVREKLHIWPTLPIMVDCNPLEDIGPEGEDNVVAALGHSDRVCYIRVMRSELEKMVTVMQVPFPALTHLELYSRHDDEDVPALSAGFLGGSAPRLQEISLSRIPFPSLPTLLLSTGNLVRLYLSGIPSTGYISPEAMAVGLAPLSKLENLWISFDSFSSDQIRPPPATRIVLPALITFSFQGAYTYLENIVACIDSPQLDRIHINFSDQLFDIPVAQLSKFLDRSMGPKLALLKHAHIGLSGYFFSFLIYRHPSSDWHISSEGIDLQVPNIAHSFRQFSATLSNVIHLRLEVKRREGRQLEGTVEVEWMHLLRQFSAIQSLYISQDLAGPISLALEDITAEMAIEVWPSLDLICLEGLPAASIEKFATARQLSGRPVIVVDTKTEFSERLEFSVEE